MMACRSRIVFHTLINPGRNIPYYITGLTGITTEMVLESPSFEEIADDIFKRLEGKIFVAHNAHFDYSFLKKEFEAGWNKLAIQKAVYGSFKPKNYSGTTVL